MNLRKLVRFFPVLAALAPLSLAAAASFGRFGESLEQAKKTHFFTWFHLEQTASGGDTRTFQPTAPKFRELVKLRVTTNTAGEIRGMTLAVQRSFIDGPDSVFARDIAKSFLDGAAGEENNDDVKQLINQIWNSPTGGRTVIRRESVRPELPATPTAAYRVFTGLDLVWSAPLSQFSLMLENREDGWLYMTVATGSKKCCAGPQRRKF
jgi:hypothetical protein